MRLSLRDMSSFSPQSSSLLDGALSPAQPVAHKPELQLDKRDQTNILLILRSCLPLSGSAVESTDWSGSLHVSGRRSVTQLMSVTFRPRGRQNGQVVEENGFFRKSGQLSHEEDKEEEEEEEKTTRTNRGRKEKLDEDVGEEKLMKKRKVKVVCRRSKRKEGSKRAGRRPERNRTLVSFYPIRLIIATFTPSDTLQVLAPSLSDLNDRLVPSLRAGLKTSPTLRAGIEKRRTRLRQLPENRNSSDANEEETFRGKTRRD
ncbi:unnamed protein product [Pleuronectes platessa]|uniref:Uncharacterized protein n=1 Tax=Pleuronectes platessa TaxID=8262 RepID=A0A9N7VNM6_PLEPL|nr:unnamed protein product [Pleuronectes platessa]